MDTPLVNGTAYPYVQVEPQGLPVPHPERLQRPLLNLQLYYAKSNTPDHVDTPTGTLIADANCRRGPDGPGASAHPAAAALAGDLADGRPGRRRAGPRAPPARMIQIGTEGGFLPAPVVLPNTADRLRRTTAGTSSVLERPSTDALPRAGRARRRHRRLLAGARRQPSSSSTTTRRRRSRRSTRVTTTTPATRTRPTRAARRRRCPATARTPAPSCSSRWTARPGSLGVRPGRAARRPAGRLRGVAATQPIVPEIGVRAAFEHHVRTRYARIQDTTLAFTPAGATTPLTLPLHARSRSRSCSSSTTGG